MRNRFEKKNTIVGLIIILALLFFCAGVSIYQMLLPVVTIKVNHVTIRQEETLPDFDVSAEFSGTENVILDEVTGYSTTDFVEDLNCGYGVMFSYKEDLSEEGIYDLEIDFQDDIKHRLVREWNRKVRYRCENGTITVLNKYGDWENSKFRFLDGTYASGWTNLGDETYYFDETGCYVVGKQVIDGNEYIFKKDGKFDVEKNPVNPNRPMIALTFDDGPGPYTMQLLEELEEHNARATFFLVGKNVPNYPKEVKKMKKIGCQIGNHSTNHARLGKITEAEVVAEIQTTNENIASIIGEGATLLRPPYGEYNSVVQSVAGLPLILWSVDTRDWESKNAQLVKEHVLNNLKDGAIILLHDIHETTLYAAVDLIPTLQEMGYQLVTVSEMAKHKGVSLQNGNAYRMFP